MALAMILEKKSYCAKHNYSYFFFNGKLSNGISVYVPESKFLFMSEQFHKVIALFYLYKILAIGSLRYRHILHMYEKFKDRKTKSIFTFKAESSVDRILGKPAWQFSV